MNFLPNTEAGEKVISMYFVDVMSTICCWIGAIGG